MRVLKEHFHWWSAHPASVSRLLALGLSSIFRLPPGQLHALLQTWPARLAQLFPHIDLNRLQWRDLLRIPLQVVWLLLFKPRRVFPASARPAARFNPIEGVARLSMRLAGLLDALSQKLALLPNWSWRQGFAMLDSWGQHPAWNHARYRRVVLTAGVGMGCVAATLPLGGIEQLALSLLLLASLVTLNRAAHAWGTPAAMLLALLPSMRYLWWRWNETLPLENQAELTCGLLLLAAEGVLWSLQLAATLALLSGSKERRAGQEFWPALLSSLAWATICVLPALAILGGFRLLFAAEGDFLAYLLPHLVGSVFLAHRLPVETWSFGQRVADLRACAGIFWPGSINARLVALAWLNLIALPLGGSGTDRALLFWPLAALANLLLAIGHVPTASPVRMKLVDISAALARGVSLCVQLPRQGGRRFLHRASEPFSGLADWLPRRPLLNAVPWIFALALLSGSVFSEAAWAKDDKPTVAATLPEAADVRRATLKALSGANTLSLRNADGHASVYFGSRADELISRLTLVVRYSHSPALLPKDSHIKIMLNDEVIGIAPVQGGNDGQMRETTIEIDPRFVADTNHLRFQFVGHYAETCEDPLRNSLWASISGSSELITEYRKLAVKDDLSLLPEPFFDRRDLRQLVVPFVFSAKPPLPTVNAAGVVASWFGKLAGGQGARFPVSANVVPPGHGVVLATNSDRPEFLRGHPLVDGPTIEMMTNPTDGISRLLLVLGRDGNDILLAAQSLALGNAVMSGGQVTIRSRRNEEPRQPYDAPNWVRSDRPTRFAELTAYPQQLQASGHLPAPLKLELRMPPDIFRFASRGVPLKLRYRHSPPTRGSESLLNVSVNGQLVQSIALSAGNGETKRFLPGDNSLVGEEKRLLLPLHKLRGGNQMQFSFAFARTQEGPCPEIAPDDARRALIDPDSTIDLSDFYHFARMPNLNHFATVGFPFTRQADLADTVLVLPDHPTPQEIEAAMNLLGQLGRSTGLPASRIRVAGPGEESLLADADLLVVGAALGEGAFVRWADYLPATISGEIRRVSQAARAENALYDWLGLGTEISTDVVTQEKIAADGPLAMLLGFESPFSPGRSVVAVTATAPEHMWMGVAALDNPELAARIRGNVSFVRGERVDSLLVGETYLVGQLPWWVLVWLPLSNHPLLLALLTIVAAVLLIAVLKRVRQAPAGEEP